MTHASKKRRSGRTLTPDVLSFNILAYISVGVFSVLCVIPFYLIIVASFSQESYLLTKGYSFLIQGFNLEAYKLCFNNTAGIGRAYINTICITLIGLLACVFLSTMTGYVLSRRDFPWRNAFAFFFFFTTLFSGGMVPSYIMNVRYWGFKNQWYALILPGMFSVWNMIISKNFMQALPEALTDSAKIDGASDFRIYAVLILPLSLPLVATLCLFSGLAYWNDWMNCLLYVNKQEMYTLQFYLQQLLTSIDSMRKAAEHTGIALPQLPEESMKMAMTVTVTGPIIFLYPFLQRFFVKGLTVGAVKG